ncbi:MAG: serine O-acetyltransferase EpsC [Lachnospiraceae bacterium]
MDNNVKAVIREVSLKLENNYDQQELFDVGIGERLPNRDVIISLVNDLRKITFPGFFGSENLAYVSKDNFAGSTLATIYEKLFQQTRIALQYSNKEQDAGSIAEKAEDLTLKFISQIPDIQALVLKDVDAELAGDPAANSKEEVIFSYPGLFAIVVYRYAHVLYELKVPMIPRIMTEHAHSRTGIDINPGATIGEYFFIDHGTGIVIGETTKIGNHVKIYQGVTLGALSTRKGQELSGVKRHPTIEDNVVIYANTTVLGGETVVGENAVVAGNSFVISSIPANSKVASTMPQLEIKEKKNM